EWLRRMGEPAGRPVMVAPAERLPAPQETPRNDSTDGFRTEGRPLLPQAAPEESWPQPVARREAAKARDSFADTVAPRRVADAESTNGDGVATGPETPRDAAADDTVNGVLAPAVVIGLGQFGLGTLRELRR